MLLKSGMRGVLSLARRFEGFLLIWCVGSGNCISSFFFFVCVCVMKLCHWSRLLAQTFLKSPEVQYLRCVCSWTCVNFPKVPRLPPHQEQHIECLNVCQKFHVCQKKKKTLPLGTVGVGHGIQNPWPRFCPLCLWSQQPLVQVTFITERRNTVSSMICSNLVIISCLDWMTYFLVSKTFNLFELRRSCAWIRSLDIAITQLGIMT